MNHEEHTGGESDFFGSSSCRGSGEDTDSGWPWWVHFLVSFLLFMTIGILGSLAQAGTVRGYPYPENCWGAVEAEKNGETDSRYSEISLSEIDFHVSSSLDWYELDGKCYQVNKTLRRMGHLQSSVPVLATIAPVMIFTAVYVASATATVTEGLKIIGWFGGYIAAKILLDTNGLPNPTAIVINIADVSVAEAWKNPCSVILAAGGNYPGAGEAYYECLRNQPKSDTLDPSQRILAPKPQWFLTSERQDQTTTATVEIGVPRE